MMCMNLWTCGSPVFENFGCMNIKFVMYEPMFVLDVWTCAGCVKISSISGMIAEAGHEWYCMCIILNLLIFYDEKQTSLRNRWHVITHVLPHHRSCAAMSSASCCDVNAQENATCQPCNRTRVNLPAIHVSTLSSYTCRPLHHTCVHWNAG